MAKKAAKKTRTKTRTAKGKYAADPNDPKRIHPDELAKLPPGASPFSGLPPPRGNRWKPGQSGNPTGKNTHNSITKALRKRLDADDGRLADAIAAQWIKSAIETLQRGHGGLLDMMLERDEGPIKQLIEEHHTEHVGDPSDLTDVELADAIERLVGERPQLPGGDGDG